jgi:hypothetical protein
MAGRRRVAIWTKLWLKVRLLHALPVKLLGTEPVSAVSPDVGDKLSPSSAIAMVGQTRSGLPKVRRL